MKIDVEKYFKPNQVVGVALSGGSDSMALLHYLFYYDKMPIKVVAVNVEHGIRGNSSVSDSLFVKSYCDRHGIPLISYSVDSLKKSKNEKLSIEQSARILRYECFFDAINQKKCDIIATAHHLSDNVESILLNLFRGTGIKGVSGISSFDGKIVRPLLSVKKSEINDYVKENNIPFVTDETNLKTDFSRNYIRLNVIPKIVSHFPDAERNIERFSNIAREEDEFLDRYSKTFLSLSENTASISLPIEKVPFCRAMIMALKHLGIEKDWEKVHIDSVYNLIFNENGKRVNLLNNVTAYKEYDKIVFAKNGSDKTTLEFKIGSFTFNGKTYEIKKADKNVDLKSGLFIDKNKVPPTAVIRSKTEGDKFTKFGGGTKSLSDFFTDNKIPLRIRNDIPLIADGNNVLAIFNVAISDDLKIDNSSSDILEIK